jgi:acyl-CoA synthetase (NDP forming)
VILLYLETFGNPRKFARLARRIGRTKPIVAVASPARPPGAAGLSRPRPLSPPGDPGDRGPASSATGPDRAGVDTLFAHAGVIRVDTVAELFDVGVLLAHQPLPAGRRVGIVGNSTALTRLATAACADGGLAVAEGYPRDLPPQTGAHEFGDALAEAATDAEADALVVVFAPPVPGQLSDEDADFATALASVALAGDKPTVVTSLVDKMPAGVPAYPSVEEAVRALARVSGYADWLRRPPGTVPEVATVDSFDVLTAYGIEVAPSLPAESAAEAVTAADRLGYPVALKSAGEALRHRLDLGAVRLDLTDESAVARAYTEMAGQFGPGVLVQAMVPPGVACVVELVEDPAFGPVVGFGLGGVATELLGDRVWRPAPLTDRDAAAMVDEPRAAPLLRGYRGASQVDREALAQLLIRVGRLADERPDVRELRLNPVLARADGLSVLHAEVVLGPPAARPDTDPRRL